MGSSKAVGIWAFLAVAIIGAAASFFALDRLRASVAPPVDMSLRTVLSHAEWASVFRKSGKVEIPFATMGPARDENPERFQLLTEATRFGTPPPDAPPDLYFNIRFAPEDDDHGRIAHFGYVVRTGAIGRGDDWGTVAPPLKEWLARLAAANPEKEYTIVDTPGGRVAAPVLPELKERQEKQGR